MMSTWSPTLEAVEDLLVLDPCEGHGASVVGRDRRMDGTAGSMALTVTVILYLRSHGRARQRARAA